MLTDALRMRREIETFSDEQLIEEMTRRGLLRTMAVATEVSHKASHMDDFLDHAERRMATDMGRALAEHRALSTARTPSRYGLTLSMELTVLSRPTSPSSTPSTA